jgi:hypothetical protein
MFEYCCFRFEDFDQVHCASVGATALGMVFYS